MKPKIAPTSPKTLQQQKEFAELYASGPHSIERPRTVPLGLTIFFALLAGLLAAAGALAGATWLSKRLPTDSWLRWFVPTRTELLTTKSTKPATPSTRLTTNERLRQLAPVLVGIYDGISTNPQTLSDLPTPAHFRGAGLLVSENGIVVTTREVVPEPTTTLRIVTDDRQVFTVKQLKTDPASAFVFLSVDGTGFGSAKLAAKDELTLGLPVSVVGRSGLPGSFSASQADVSGQDLRFGGTTNALVESSEKLARVFTVSGSGFGNGSVVADENGVVFGLTLGQTVGGRQAVAPIWYATSALRQLLRGTDLVRPSFGVSYVDLAGVPTLAATGLDKLQAGAWLTTDDPVSRPVLAAKSPAAAAKLKAGDVITQINRTVIDASNPLADVVQELTAGEQVTVTYQRGTHVSTVKLTLGVQHS